MLRPVVAAIGVVALLFAAACSTERDGELFDTVGVTRLFVIDPGQLAQDLSNPDAIQVAQWQIASAVLELGSSSIDLAIGEACTYTDTILVTPIPQGACTGGIVIPATEDSTVEVRLTLEVTSMVVRRALLPDLTMGDYDLDGKPNDGDGSGSAFDNPCGLDGDSSSDCDDNCPLVSNPTQNDGNADGVGDACSVFDIFSGQSLLDSDSDAVPDSVDNCVSVPNPDQADEVTGVSGEGIPDGIGDACQEQVAAVRLDGASSFTLSLPFAPLDQPIGTITLITVDFTNPATLSCDWSGSGTCELDPQAVQMCGLDSTVFALAGCPG